MSIALEFFCLTVAVMMSSAAELSIFIGVGGSWSVMRRGTDVFPLWKSALTSASAADATMCFRVLHSMWIGLFAGGGRFGDFDRSVGSELR